MDVITGEVRDKAIEFQLSGPARFEWRRYYGTLDVNAQRGNGWGHRHEFDRRLRFDLDGVRYEQPAASVIEFGHLEHVGDRDTRQGHVLERVGADLYQVRTAGAPAYEFRRGFGPKRRVALLTRMYEGLHEARFEYDSHERLVGVVDYAERTLRVEWDREGL
ncbi:MAG: hypothetical protein KC668_27320, partial [Myxococcales bacterium]|nr:hypothetical protein [Myxococcales bacterium]